MKEFLPVLRSSVLLSGISEEDLISMLACLDAKTKSYPKDAFLFRAGDTAESIGLVLSATVTLFRKRRRDRRLPRLMPARPAPSWT